tara:strand:+ start:19 stop:540 length:522 start_codon:yes stop_codon:yes gene_type:complete
MAETKLRERAVIEKLNSMAVDVIDLNLTTDAETIGDNACVSQSIEIPNAVAVNGGSGIIQSIMVHNADNSLESPALEFIIAQANTTIASDEGAAINITGANTITNFLGSFTVSNYSTMTPSDHEFAVKTNIGLAVKADDDTRSLYLHVINRSGGDYTPSTTGQLSCRIGIVKD